MILHCVLLHVIDYWNFILPYTTSISILKSIIQPILAPSSVSIVSCLWLNLRCQVQNAEDKDREIALYSMPLGMPGAFVARAGLALEKIVLFAALLTNLQSCMRIFHVSRWAQSNSYSIARKDKDQLWYGVIFKASEAVEIEMLNISWIQQGHAEWNCQNHFGRKQMHSYLDLGDIKRCISGSTTSSSLANFRYIFQKRWNMFVQMIM